MEESVLDCDDDPLDEGGDALWMGAFRGGVH